MYPLEAALILPEILTDYDTIKIIIPR